MGDSFPGEVESDELIGSVLAGRYRIESLLGAGGMGAVYRAQHVHMRKAIAVKVLHREMTQMPEVVARFEREAVAAARITHPNVAAATDFGRLEDGSFYLALEFIEGQSLASAIKSGGALDESRALRLARQIADALAAAHAAGVVHRDLKPDNVMLVERNGSPDFVKVLDFGIAKVKLEASSDQPLTQMGMVFGTPEYMSPEQAQGLDVDARADLYALGVILYEMLAGHSPFKHEDLVAVLTRQITMDPPPLPASVSKAAADLTFKLLRKSPAERPQTGDEVRNRIDAILNASTFDGAALGAPPSSVTPAATVVTSPDLVTSAEAHTELSLPLLRRMPYASLLTFVRRLGLERRLAVGRYSVPLGAALGLGALLLVVIGLSATLLLMSGDDGRGDANAAVPPRPHDPDVLALVAKAEVGDAAAIAALSARPAEKRSLVEWRAIAHGYCLLSNFAACLRVYSEGVTAHSVMASDPSLLSDVRRIADRPDLAADALGFAARALDTAGADLLFDVVEKGKTQSPSVQRARALLEEEPAKSHISAALRAQLLLQAAMKKPRCADLKRLLPDLSNDADERAVPLLTRLMERRGCGFLGLSDCYGCLRTGGDLARVLEAARGRARPSFALAPTLGAANPIPASSNR
ncbi:MAG TPA: serine/threonine-protein kinase [Polyangiaceae bacterium]|nr:serine/threonine-protein kinase [Polyangiaceae bacterium]